MVLQTLQSIYRVGTSLRLSFWLLLLLTGDLILGYICVSGNASLFEPMNQIGLQNWLVTYGRSSLLLSGWFYLLLALLLCLVINTVVCTIDKLYHLFIKPFAGTGSKRFWLTITIHLMHLAMALLLVGYLISYSFSSIDTSVTLLEKGEAEFQDGKLRIELRELELVSYRGKHDSFKGRFIDANADLTLYLGNESKDVQLSFNNPVYFQGYGVFLQRFNPMYLSSMSPARYIIVDVRRDPGMRLTFSGMALFVLGMTAYLYLRNESQHPRSV